MAKLRRSKMESWLQPVLHKQTVSYAIGWDLEPMGRTLLRKWAERECTRFGRLTPDHAVRIHDRLSVMAKAIDGARYECGMIKGPGWRDGWRWVYGAIAVLDGDTVTSGSVLIPGAACIPYVVRKSLSAPTQYHRGYRLWDDLCGVNEEVSTEANEILTLTRNQVPRKTDVRPGDCFLYDLTLRHSPRFRVENKYFGRACAFGSCDEMIDTARCRLVFGSLASA